MSTIKITLTLYGPIDKFAIPYDQKSYLFIDNILSDMPGLNASLGEVLTDNARVGIFSPEHIYPYQYRDGLPMSESLTKELKKREGGVMHNTY